MCQRMSNINFVLKINVQNGKKGIVPRGFVWYNFYIIKKEEHYKMKNLITKYVVKPKSQRTPITVNETLFMIAICVLPLYIIAYGTVLKLYDLHDALEKSQRTDLCRISGVITNDDGTQSYLCKSKKIGKNKFMIIEQNESNQLDENPYINRPVIVYKNGTVKWRCFFLDKNNSWHTVGNLV